MMKMMQSVPNVAPAIVMMMEDYHGFVVTNVNCGMTSNVQIFAIRERFLMFLFVMVVFKPAFI